MKSIKLDNLCKEKKSIYKGLKKLTSYCRKHGHELYQLQETGYFIDLDEKVYKAIMTLSSFIPYKYEVNGLSIHFDEQLVKDKFTIFDLYNNIVSSGFNDEVASLYCTRVINDTDNVYVFVYHSNLKTEDSSMDAFVVNTKGEKR